MINQEGYLASDLAAELQVPRTTLNDWLTRYAAHLEFELRGKRKIYSPRSLDVLKAVAALRDSGLGAFEIENELTAKFGIRPEVDEPPAPTETPSAAESSASADTAVIPSAQPALPALPTEADWAKLSAMIEELQERRQSAVRRFYWIMAGLLLTVILAGTWLTGKVYQAWEASRRDAAEQIESLRQDNRSLQNSLTEAGKSLETMRQESSAREDAARKDAAAKQQEFQKAIQDLSDTMKQTRLDDQNEIKRLAAELDRQRAEARAELEKLRQTESGRRTAEIIRIKEEFAKTQKELLERLDRESAERIRLEKEAAARKALDSLPPPAPAPAAEPVATVLQEEKK